MRLMTKVLCGKKYLFVPFFLIVVLFNYAAAEEKINAVDVSEKGKGPLVVYYSRTGNTRVVAEALSKAIVAENIESGAKTIAVITEIIDI